MTEPAENEDVEYEDFSWEYAELACDHSEVTEVPVVDNDLGVVGYDCYCDGCGAEWSI